MRLFRCSRHLGARALVAGSLALGLAAMARPVAGQTKPGGPFTTPSGLARVASPDPECCLLMLLPIGARQTSMAMAVTPIASPDAVFYNPAGLAQVDGSHFVIHHLESDIQPFDAFTLLVSPGNLAVFGLSYVLSDHGVSDLTGEDQQVVGRVSSADHLLVASFATSLLANFTAGLNYKFFNWRSQCSGACDGFDRNAKTHAIDIGVQYQPSWFSNVRVGAALLNAGLPLQVENAEQSDPLPTRLRLGVSYDLMQHFDSIGPYSLVVLVEAQEDDWKRPTTPRGAVAMEASVADFVFLRAGYGAGEGLEAGPAVGVGVVYSSINVAVAKRVNGSVLGDDPFQLTIDVGF